MKIIIIVMEPTSDIFDDTLSVLGTGRKENRSIAVRSLTFQLIEGSGSIEGIFSLFSVDIINYS